MDSIEEKLRKRSVVSIHDHPVHGDVVELGAWSSSIHEHGLKNAKEPQKNAYESTEELSVEVVKSDLRVTGSDLADANEYSTLFTLDEVRTLMLGVIKIHQDDPNFPYSILEKIREFLENPDVMAHPENHEELIKEIKLEAALITTNSPYAEVRSVVDNVDDVTMPSSTIRAWVIGIFFVAVLSLVNQLFTIRQPNIFVNANVAQLLCFPLGKAAEKLLPDWGFTLFGSRHSLNPGRFSRKEHMLITIMANVGANTPYTDNIIWAQYLPQYFNQSYAGHFSYQILIGLGTNFVGYGIAGICRKFLVYPSYCVWPASLVTIALNAAFHTETNEPVAAPFKRVFRASRLKFFVLAFAAMFVYFWFPNYLFQAMSNFNWMTWIAPSNTNLVAVTGFNTGMGINPIPTFDWNVLLFNNQDPLMVPFFNTLNKFIGTVMAAIVAMGMWYTNTYNTGYLPINSNRVWDHTAKRYNISQAIDSRGLFDAANYENYSPAFLAAGNLTVYLFFFAVYSATISYAFLYHRHEIAMGFRNFFGGFRKNNKEEKGAIEYTDIHNRLMSKYPEVPEWWYFSCLLLSIAFACAGIAGWETYTSVGVVFYGIALCLIFVIPIGIIQAITGIQVTLNVLAEFIGGSWVAGNALAMNFFKSFGYVTCAHALNFSNDLKLAHYVKIPPRHTFWAQMVATLVSTFICTAILNFQMNQIEGVCTATQKNHFTCPGINTFFTAAVLWGTIGPKKVFGVNGQYTALLVGFPIGFILPFIFYFLQKRYKNQTWLRQAHPVVMLYGALTLAPYNLAYIWPSVPIGWLSMVYIKKKYLGLWSKYNFVLSASWSSAIAIAAIIIFFALQWSNKEVTWWGNTVSVQGCEGAACPRLHLAKGAYFGKRIGTFH